MSDGINFEGDTGSLYYATGDFPPFAAGDFIGSVPLTFYGTGVCDCGYGGRHSRFRHWFRLRYLKERW
jgi:hypothetical protein